MENQRHQMRQYIIDTWKKRDQIESVTPLERNLLEIIKTHPDYHKILDNPNAQEKDYRSDNNPFLHISLHMGLVEQLTTNRPAGICDLYQKFFEKIGDEHQAQHLMMEVMGDIIWDAQQANKLPDEQVYVKRLQALL